MNKKTYRLVVSALIGIVAVACSDAPEVPDVVSELPGELRQRSFMDVGPPTIECMGPASVVRLEQEDAIASVPVQWTTNIGIELERANYALSAYVDGQRIGTQRTLAPVLVELPFGEHLVTLALLGPEGSVLRNDTSRCNVRIQVTRTCETDTECEDDFFCNDPQCLPSDDGISRCHFKPAEDSLCCQQDFECTFGEFCDTERNQCVTCLADNDCNDQSVCTTDSCIDGQCQQLRSDPTCCDCNAKTTPPSSVNSQCNDGKECTTDRCDCAANRCLFESPDTQQGPCCEDGDPSGVCDDGNACNVDVCVTGVCQHLPPANTEVECCNTNADCYDGNACTNDVCDTAVNQCIRLPVNTPACQAQPIPQSAGLGTALGATCAHSSPQPEVCNGLDDDCDGLVDENKDGRLLTRSCENACGDTGVASCDAGSFVSCSAATPIEVCGDRIDNDCDGKVDEGWPNCSMHRPNVAGVDVKMVTTLGHATSTVHDNGDGTYRALIADMSNPNNAGVAYASVDGVESTTIPVRVGALPATRLTLRVLQGSLHIDRPEAAILVEATDAYGRPVKMGTSIEALFTDKNRVLGARSKRQANCETDANGRCLIHWTAPKSAFSKGGTITVAVQVDGLSAITAELAALKAPEPMVLTEAGAALTLPRSPVDVGQTFTAAVFVKSGGDQPAAYDLSIDFDRSALEITAVEAGSCERFDTPVSNLHKDGLANGPLRLNATSLLGDKSLCPTQADGSIHVANVTFRALRPVHTRWHATLRGLYGHGLNVLAEQAPILIGDSAGTDTTGFVAIQPTIVQGVLSRIEDAQLLSWGPITDKTDSTQIELTGYRHNGTTFDALTELNCQFESSAPNVARVDESGMITAGAQAGMAEIKATCNTHKISQQVRVLTLGDVDVSLSDNLLQAIAGTNGTLQTATVKVIATWVDQENQPVWHQDITDHIVIEVPEGIAYDASRSSLRASSIGEHTIAAKGASGSVLGSSTLTVDPSAEVTCSQLDVLAPCEVHVTQFAPQAPTPQLGQSWAQVSVSARMSRVEQSCPVQLVASCSDGVRMDLTGQPTVSVISDLPGVVLAKDDTTLHAVGSGSARLQAVWTVDGLTLATGESTVRVDLPKPVALTVQPSSTRVAVSENDPAASLLGLPTQQSLQVVIHYEDGTARFVDSSEVVIDTINSDSSQPLLQQEEGGVLRTTGNAAGIARTRLSLRDNVDLPSTESVIEVVRTVRLIAEVVESYTPTLPQMPVRQLSTIEHSGTYQHAQYTVRVQLSDGTEIDVTNHPDTKVTGRALTARKTVDDIIAVHGENAQIHGVGSGSVDLRFAHGALSTSIVGFEVTDRPVDVASLHPSLKTGNTVSAIKDTGDIPVNVWAQFSDGSRRMMTGDGAIDGLLTFKSSDVTAATIDSSGSLTVRGNLSTVVSIDLSRDANARKGLAAPAEIAFDCNLLPSIGDFDLGAESGLAFPDVQVGDTFTYEARLNTGDIDLGAFDVALHFDPKVLKVVKVTPSDSVGAGPFYANWRSEAGSIFVNGLVSPMSSPVQGDNVALFDITFKALKGGDGISEIGGEIRRLVAQDAVTTIGAPTPRSIVAGNGLMDPNCANEPIYGDANDNCEFGAEDGLFIQRYLAGMEAPSAAQLSKMDTYPDNEVSVADALYNSQVLAKLTHFIKVIVEPSATGDADLVVKVIDRDQQVVTSNVKVILEVWVSDLFDSLDFDNFLGIGEDAETKLVTATHAGEGRYRTVIKGLSAATAPITVRVTVILSTMEPGGNTAIKTIAFLGSKEITGGKFKLIKEFAIPLAGTSGCFSDSDCDVAAYCDNVQGPGSPNPTKQCQSKKDDGELCPKPTACKTDHCQNDYCCASGDCCTATSQCPSSYAIDSQCQNASSCQGIRKDTTCLSFMCGNTPVNDDSACITTTEANGCSCYLSVFCVGGSDQNAPTCPDSCTDNVECDVSCHCDGICEADLPNGSTCDENSDCISDHCSNNICCDKGLCCKTTDFDPQAPISDALCQALATSPDCGDPITCQGTRNEGVCNVNTFECEATPIQDDTACVTNTKALDCGCTLDVYCEGGFEQFPPSCPKVGCSNENNTTCKENCHCDATSCVEDLPNGSACDESSDCISDYCSNGYCCDNDGTNPLCCGVPDHCPGSFSGASSCFTGANSLITGFSNTQGENQWTYETHNPVSGYVAMSYGDAGAGGWFGPGASLIRANNMQPGGSSYAASLGYTVRGGGQLTVSGTLTDADASGGDGIRVEVRQNNAVVYSTDLANGFDPLALSMRLDVAAGDMVRLVILPKLNSNQDLTNVVITMALATCQGEALTATCFSGRCDKEILPNDKGCGTTSVARTCSPYNTVYCNGTFDQHEPACAETCSNDAELNAGNACVANTPFVVLELSEGSGLTTVDETGNGYDALLSGDQAPLWATGQAGQAIAFSQIGTPGGKASELLLVSGTPTVRFTSGLGVAAWVKWGGTGKSSDQIIVGKGSEWGLGIQNGKLAFHVNAETGIGSLWEMLADQQQTNLPKNQWTHVACTWNGVLVRLYIDGTVVAVAAKTGFLPHKTEAVMVGQLSESNTNIMPYLGSVDQLILADYPLSDAQVSNLLKGSSLPPNPATKTLSLFPVSYLSFDMSETDKEWGNMAIGKVGTGGNNGQGVNWRVGYGRGFGCGTPGCGNTGGGNLGYPATVNGKWGKALSCGQYGEEAGLLQDAVSLQATKTVNFANGFSLGAWVKWGGIGETDTQWIIHSPGQFGLGLYKGRPFVTINESNVLKTVFDGFELSAASMTNWTHVAATWDSLTIRLYINGVFVASVDFAQPLAANTHDVFVAQAGGSSTNSNQFLGLIDEVIVLNAALPETTSCSGKCTSTTVSGAFQPLITGNVIAPSTKVGVLKRFNGSPCPATDGDNACAGGHCANNICCDVGICCAQISQCPTSFTIVPTCDDSATCQGTRGDPMCVAFQCATNIIDDDRGCLVDTEAQDCSCYVSLYCTGDATQTGPTCPSSCSGEADCDGNCTCDTVCKPKEPNGTTCDENVDCTSGFCVDGVCCDAGCDGLCEQCNIAGAVGTCTSIFNGQDPDNECIGTGLCGGTCDGSGECQYPKATVDCGLCRRCDGLGGCTNLVLAGTDPDMDCPLCNVCDGTGKCTIADVSTDIKGDCAESSVSTCGTNGDCDGSGACQLYASETICQAQACIDGFVHTIDQCNGTGGCLDSGTYSCDPYACNDTECWTTCVDATQCNPNAYCDVGTGQCIPRKETGSKCDSNDQCQSSFCVDGYCCGSSCTALCNRCDITPGQCLNVAGGLDPDDECNGTGNCGGTCNGSGSCQYPPVTLNCGNCIRCNGLGECSNYSEAGSDPDIQCPLCEVCNGSGTCTPTAAGLDPKGECDAKAQSTCDLDGSCDGSSACRLWVDETECVPPKCETGIGFSKQVCDGLGLCQDPTQAACDPYVCGSNTCLTSCQKDAECIDTHFCDTPNKTCQPKKALAKPCSGNSHCISGFCTDGVCCNTDCGTACESCNLPGLTGSCTNHPQDTDPENDCAVCNICDGSGQCVVVPENTDPLSECAIEPASTCANDGVCSGAGACRKWASGTICTSPTCDSATSQLTDYCDGVGSCVDGDSVSCAPYQCKGTACGDTCTTDDGCVSTHWCSAPICQPKKLNGIPCGGNNECKTGFCVDGVCCATACTSACAQCNLPGTVGDCAAHGAGTDPESGCSDYYCNGLGFCHSTCSADPDCKPLHWCSGNTCVDQKELGETCTTNTQCLSDHCVDGYCCNTACDSECNACDLANSVGSCSKVPVGQDPDEECNGGGPCGGTCDGSGQCSFPINTLNCGSCRRCDGIGNCGYVPVNTDPDGSCALCQVCNGNGQCSFSPSTLDVKSECSPETPESDCGRNGLCNAAGACGYYGESVTCGPESCSPPTDYLCKLTGASGSSVNCTIKLAGKTQTNIPVAIAFRLKYDNVKATLLNASCPALNGAIDTCNQSSGASLPPPFAGGGGHDILTNPVNSSDWAGNVKFSIYSTAAAIPPINGGYFDNVGTMIGDDFVMELVFKLKTSFTSNSPLNIEISEIDPADVDGTTLGAGVESNGRIVGCSGGGCTKFATHFMSDICNSKGSCGDGGTESCSPYVCGTTQCRTSCSSHYECTITHYCSTNSTCIPRKQNGASCVDGYECVAGHCQNGYCCSSGECCATTADCGAFNIAPNCTDALNCKGQRTEFSCNGNKECAAMVINDATGCYEESCVAPFCTGGSSVLQHVAAKTCNKTGQCNEGGGLTPCADGNVCTDDSCVAVDGCTYTPNVHSESCYDGPVGTLDVGECKGGAKTCAGASFGLCVGQVTPTSESCNSKDDDCDNSIDEPNAIGCTVYYLDADIDTYGVMGSTQCLCTPKYPYTATVAGDCNDSDGTVNPAMTEACNGKDDNCNNIIDEEDATGCALYYHDEDNDTYGVTTDSKCLCSGVDPYDTTSNGDCNDAVDTTYPGALEMCDGVDNDCDNGTPGGGIDEDYDLGTACDGADADSCKEGVNTCNETQDAVQCSKDGAAVILTADRVNGTTAVNEAEPKLDGTMIGIVSLTAANGGKVKRAFDMAGGGYVSVENSTLMNMKKSGGTVAFWMNSYTMTAGNFSVLAAKGYDAKRSFEFRYYGSNSTASMQNLVRPYFQIGASSFYCANDLKVKASEGWVHLAVAVAPNTASNQTTMSIYKNGALHKSCTFPGLVVDNTESLQLGRTTTSGSSPYVGRLDEFALYTYALTANEVATLHTDGIATGVRNHELCDSADNNCSNTTDEGFTDVGQACADGTGPCKLSGSIQCAASGVITECSAKGGKAAGTTCSDSTNCSHTDVCTGFGDVTGSGNAFSNKANPGTGADKAFDDNPGTFYEYTGAGPWQLTYDFGKKTRLGKYSLQAGPWGEEGRMPKHFSFQAQDGTSWVTLNTQLNQSFSTNEKKTYSFANVNAYNKYRLNITAVGNGGTIVRVFELEMMSATTASECVGTSYSCSGTCRSCSGNVGTLGDGECSLGSGCYIAGGCSASEPSCGNASSCKTEGQAKGTTPDETCQQCTPSANKQDWSAAPSTKVCTPASCTGLTYHSAYTCGSGLTASTCIASTPESCNDSNVCTDDNCADATGCFHTNNSYQSVCYTGNANQIGVGTCSEGIKTCSGGSFGTCEGEILPVAETCAVQGEDGLDNDCDGIIDNITDLKTWCRDVDGDNHGNPTGPNKYHCEQPTGFALDCDDCDDLDSLRYPGNTESCDEIDNNCNDQIDEDFTTKGDACDGDDLDECKERILVCNEVGDGVSCGTDRGPFAAFSFDKGILGSTIVNEAADDGNDNNNAKISNMSKRLGVQDGLDRALYTPGGSKETYMYIPSKGFSGSGWSVALWFYPLNTGGKYYLSVAGKGTYNALALSASGRLYLRGIKKTNSTLVLTKNAWNFVVITHSSTTGYATAYINNKQKWKGYMGQKSFKWTSHVWFGQEQDKLNGGFQSSQAAIGKFDNIALYNYALTSKERAALYADKAFNKVYLNREMCDGLDNNCNGQSDELYSSTLGSACSAGEGTCKNSGTFVCAADALSTECSTTGKASTFICNDSNDCSHDDLCSAVGDVTSGGTPFATNDNGVGALKADAFDDNELGTFWEYSAAGPWEIGYDFSPTGARVQAYSLTSGEFGEHDRMPKDWIFQGYTGSGWKDLDTQAGVSFGAVETKSYSFTNSVAYAKYRLLVSKVGNDGNIIRIFEFKMDGGTTKSVCRSTNYACSGTCRVCDGTGSCKMTTDTCYITGGTCDYKNPSADDDIKGGITVTTCDAGTCFDKADDKAGNKDTHDAGDGSCHYCDPAKNINEWSYRGDTWICRPSFCDPDTPLRFHPNDMCGTGAKNGVCENTAYESCIDYYKPFNPNLSTCTNSVCADDSSCNCPRGCTNDICADTAGCGHTDNTAVYDSDCYTGPGGTKNVGICHGGTQYCKDGSPELVSGQSKAKCNNEALPYDELCDLKDNDCDHSVDEGTMIDYYRDADSDGYGDPSISKLSCGAPEGYVESKLDCVDSGYTLFASDYAGAPQGWSTIQPSAYSDGYVHGLFGGTTPSVSKTYTDLPTHTKLRINARYWAIDSWDQEWGRLKVDGQVVWEKQRTFHYNCAGNDGDWSVYTNQFPNPWSGDDDNHKCYADIDVTLDHSSSTATIEFSSTIDQLQSDESYAFNKVRISYNARLKDPLGYWGKTVTSADINPSAVEKCNGINDNCACAGPSQVCIDEFFTDKGDACDSDDDDLCTDSIKVCNLSGDDTMCTKDMVWGTYGLGSSASTVIDISGYGNHGTDAVGHTASNTPPLTIPIGSSTNAYPQVLDFNGSTNYVKIDHGADKPFNLSSPQITMSAWVRWNGSGGSQIIVNKENSYEMGINNGRFQCAVQTDGGGDWFWVGATFMVAHKWTHVACTYDTASCKIQTWVAGGLNIEKTDGGCGPVTASSQPLYIGMRPGGSYFGGQMAAIAIYDRKFTPSEMTSRATESTIPFGAKHLNYEYCDGVDNDCDTGKSGGGIDELYKSGSKALGANCHGGVGDCRNDGNMVCENNQFYWDDSSMWGRSTICNAYGDPKGTVCTDSVNCTHTDRCTGGINSTCTGTTYSCSGSCRSCDGLGTCDLASNKCYITGSGCGSPANIELPGCTGTCYNSGMSSNGVTSSTNHGNTSCTYCDPKSNSVGDSTNYSWTNRPLNWQCRTSICSGLTWNLTDKCTGTGTCFDSGTNNCVDGNICTNDKCASASGCSNPNNSYAQSCYTGPAGTLDIGDCHAGIETCSSGSFGTCDGQVTPGTETCDAVPYNDEDCDSGFNEEGATGCTVYYKDADADGYGLTNDFKCLCKATFPYNTTKKDDCDDTNKNAAPNLKEKCGTAYDDDCDGSVNEDFPVSWNDHVKPLVTAKCAGCHTGGSSQGGANFDSYANTQKTSNCDGSKKLGQMMALKVKDPPCGSRMPKNAAPLSEVEQEILAKWVSGGMVETSIMACTAAAGQLGFQTYYKDVDDDAYGLTAIPKCKCSGSSHWDTKTNGDCDDTKSAIHPNATEKCNYIDDDCQGGIDEDYNVGTACSKGSGTCKNSGKYNCNAAGTGTICGTGSGTGSITGKPAGTACADSNNCTYGDKCSGGDSSSCKGTAYTCNDSKSCTDNNCIHDSLWLCSYPIQSGKCLIGGTCYNSGNFKGQWGDNKCHTCTPSTSKVQWSASSGSTACTSSSCSGLTHHKTDYCGAQGSAKKCVDAGTTECNGGNICYNYACSASSGCSSSKKGNGTKCGGYKCVGDTYHGTDKCQDGVCKDGGTTDCNNTDNSCRNGACVAQFGGQNIGCLTTNYSSGTQCEAKKCVGQTYHKKDTCDGQGVCNDNGTVNCNAADSQCANGYCNTTDPGCKISNYGTTTGCTNGSSKQCIGGVWHAADYCNNSGSCTDNGSTNCTGQSTTCRTYSCAAAQGGCVYSDKATSVVCASKYCITGCKKQNNTYCNGSGSCSTGGGTSECNSFAWGRCTGGSCTGSCTSNGQCCSLLPWNTAATCIGSSCAGKAGCKGTCDASDTNDCGSGLGCVNCASSSCQSHSSGWKCYKTYNADSKCGCAKVDIYNNCIKYNTCWHC